MDTSPSTPTAPRPRPARVVALALAAGLAVGPLTGCAALRVESGPPVTPSADAVEQARQRQAIGAARVVTAADDADATTDGAKAAIVDVRSAARTQLDALGGVWVPFPESTTTSPAPTGTPTPAPDPEPLLDVLAEESSSALADAATVSDGRLARLFAAIGVERRLAAARLALAEGADVPATAAPVDPEQIPVGLSAVALGPAIASEDALGLAWEVTAARSSGTARTEAAAIAAEHRARAATWAAVTEVAGTGLDPRRASYDLPEAVLDPEADPADRLSALAGLEDELATLWLDLVVAAAPGARMPLIDAFAAAAQHSAHLTGTVPALPGMPDAA
ncbi:MAG: ferritin-like domain-containing protein [Actinomycetales bacterium]|nr:ferritin-like domain-containing protein [Actinomycetales bacterium]